MQRGTNVGEVSLILKYRTLASYYDVRKLSNSFNEFSI